MAYLNDLYPKASYLLDFFHSYYRVLLHQKRRILREQRKIEMDDELLTIEEGGVPDEQTISQDEDEIWAETIELGDLPVGRKKDKEEEGLDLQDALEIGETKARARKTSSQGIIEKEEMNNLANHIALELMEILEEQTFQASHHGGDYALSLIQEAHYAMVALADEIFLQMEWAGRRFWEKNILETRMFHTHVAGEKLFEQIEEFLRIRDPAKVEMAIIYLCILGLGFRGRYQGKEDEGRIDYYKKQLYVFITHQQPMLFEKPERRLFEDAYEPTLEDGVIQLMPNARLWYVALLITVILYLAITYTFWYKATHEIKSSVYRIVNELTEK